MSAPSDDAHLRRAVEVIQALERRLADRDAADAAPVAIVGMACRLPGCDNPEDLWRLLDDGRDPIQPSPHAGGACAGVVASVDQFDASFFEISAREAETMDPRQRLTLETTWEALECARIVPGTLEGAAVGVYVGASGFVAPLGNEGSFHEFTGALPGVIAGRVSHFLGLRGPCMSIDTACSSSLVALHLACKALRARECTLAIAGGVALVEPSFRHLDSPELLAHLAKRGRCRTFDASADGIVLSDGCGMLVLKRLRDAERDGDRILAVIRGSAVNHDGRALGLTVPNLVAQETVLRNALADARVRPEDVSYVECHGTGTPLGDPIEVQALGSVFGPGRARPLVLGSIKSNIGHTDAAAGIAGVLKVILALQQGRIPKNLHFDTPNPHIPWDDVPVTVAAAAIPWPRNGTPRIAGVSSFGLSGTNAHVVVEEAPVENTSAHPAGPTLALELVALSARTPAALDRAAARLAAHLDASPEPAPALGDLAYSLATTRSHHEHRLALAAGSLEELRAELGRASRGEAPNRGARGEIQRGKEAWLFTGQGSQAPGMGRALAGAWPAFREALEAAFGALDRHLDVPLREVIWAEPGTPRAAQLSETAYTQPAMFALEIALAALWRSWGAEPDIVTGHSIGELAAAYVAGVFSLEDAARLVAVRGRLMQALPREGAMCGIAASEEAVRAAADKHAGTLDIAAINGPMSIVLSGAAADVAAVAAAFAARGVRTKPLDVSHAFHSPLMAPMLEAFRSVAESVTYHAPERAIVSNVTGEVIGAEIARADYWVRHAREAVRFADGVRSMQAAGVTRYLEIGPKATLLGLLPAVLEDASGDAVLVASLRAERAENDTILEAVARRWVTGGSVDGHGLFPLGGRRVDLPSYAWQRERYPIHPPPPVQRGGGVGLEAELRGLADRLSEADRAVVPRLLEALSAQRVEREVADSCYRVDWRAVGEPRPTARGRGRWLVLQDDAGLAEAIARALERAGRDATVVASSEGLAGRLFAGGVTGVVRVRGSDREVLELLKLLAAHDGDVPRVWLVTSGAVSTGHGDAPSSVSEAVTWGLGRSFALEHPRAWGGLVDIATDDASLDRAVAWMLDSTEDQLAVRQAGVFVPRLVGCPPGASDTAGWTTGGVALVTGGLGGLGLQVARWLAATGVRLLLTSRRGLDAPGARDAVEQLRARGADVTVARADVADREAMAAALSTVAAPITAVFHVAGVSDGTPLMELSVARLAEVLAAKREGTEVLARLTRGHPLDAFVCFSSCAGVWGAGGQAAYAASNTYLDAWAAAARSAGLPAMSISWGRWAGPGMGTDARIEDHLARRGLRAMAPTTGLRALEHALLSNRAHSVVADVDWSAFRRSFEAWGPRPLLADLGRGVDPGLGRSLDRGPAERDDGPAWTSELRALSPAARRAALLQAVRVEAARVLAIASPASLSEDRPLKELGFDSLMAVELRNALGKRLGMTLPATLVFDHPTPRALAEHLDSRLGARLDEAGAEDRSWGVAHETRDNADEARLCHLSLGQERMWFLDRLAPGSSQYNELFGLRLDAALDVDLLRRSLAALVRRHESLRTTFPEVPGFPDGVEGPRALIAPDGRVPLDVVDLRNDEQRDTAFLQIAADFRSRPFDLARGPLFRVLAVTLADRRHVVLFAEHHIITDGASWRIFATELATLYLRGADAGSLPKPVFHYSDFVRHERARVATAAHAEQRAWWKQQLEGLSRLELPYSRNTERPSHAGDAVIVPLSPAVRHALRDFVRREGCTLYEVLLAAWASVLARYSGQTSFAVGSLVANRARSEVARIVGFFVNTVVLRCDLSERGTFRALVRRMARTVHDALARQEVDFGEVVQAHTAERTGDGSPILQSTLNLLPPLPELADGWAWADDALPATRAAKFDLALEFLETSDGLRARLEYATGAFERGTIERMVQHFCVLLEAGLADADAAFHRLPLLTSAEREALLVAPNRTAADYPETLAHHLFEDSARRNPAAVALVYEGEELTYGELDARANQLAHHLVSVGQRTDVRLGPGVIVGVCLERSFEMFVALLAVVKTGAAYLPLDPAYPRDRLAFLLGDARAPLFVSNARALGSVDGFEARLVHLDLEKADIERRPRTPVASAAKLDDLVYVLYTSGSTGKPKGVEVHHRGLVNVVWHFARELQVTPDDSLLGIASFSFDMSAVDIWLPLTQGATLRVASQRQIADAVLLREEVDRSTLMQATPSTWLMLIEAGWTGSPRLRAVCGGEALTWQLATQLVERTRRVWNNYGPTETTVWSMCWPIDLARRAVSLGHAISNTRLYVLDANLEPVPVGVPGELCIGGVGVARGYWDRPELTRDRFVDDPFAGTPGQRMYRTGDRVRWALDGTMEYVERLDFQVKVRGFRIELGEIEAALESHPAISRGAVIAERSGLDARLVGYYVAKDGSRLEPDDVRRFLTGSLPGHMVPSVLVELPELPLSPNGKVDRPALARLERPAVVASANGAGEDDAVVRSLASVWKEVLGLEVVDLERSFFEQGGTSLQLVRVQRRLAAEWKIDVSVAELFAYPSIELLAGQLSQRTAQRKVPTSVTEPPASRDEDSLEADAVRDRLRDLEELSLSDLQRAVSDGLGDLLDEQA